jgi:hypothetical protein
VRHCGLPTVLERLLPQAVRPGLPPAWAQPCAAHREGVRPERAAHQAVARAPPSREAGEAWGVDRERDQGVDRGHPEKWRRLVKGRSAARRGWQRLARSRKAGVLTGDGVAAPGEGTPPGGPAGWGGHATRRASRRLTGAAPPGPGPTAWRGGGQGTGQTRRVGFPPLRGRLPLAVPGAGPPSDVRVPRPCTGETRAQPRSPRALSAAATAEAAGGVLLRRLPRPCGAARGRRVPGPAGRAARPRRPAVARPRTDRAARPRPRPAAHRCTVTLAHSSSRSWPSDSHTVHS